MMKSRTLLSYLKIYLIITFSIDFRQIRGKNKSVRYVVAVHVRDENTTKVRHINKSDFESMPLLAQPIVKYGAPDTLQITKKVTVYASGTKHTVSIIRD